MGAEFCGLFKILGAPVELGLKKRGPTAVIVRVCIIRFQFDGSGEISDGLIVLSFIIVGIAPVDVGINIILL